MATPLETLRAAMQTHGVDAVYVPMGDPHDSEYVGQHFAALRYLSGFSGSAGTLVVYADWAGLWTDGRYFIQAAAQLTGSGIELMRQGLPQVPTPFAHLAKTMRNGQVLALDGRCVSAQKMAQLKKQLAPRGVTIQPALDLVGEIWADRPPRSAAPLWEYPVEYAGLSRARKCARLREQMEEDGIDYLPLSVLDEIAWLLNLRGGDIRYTPVFLAFFLLGRTQAELFVQTQAVSPALRRTLERDGIVLRPYETFYDALRALPPDCVLSLDRASANSYLVDCIPPGCTLRWKVSPIQRQKAVKHAAEIAGSETAHLRDSVALTRFMHELKSGRAPATELDAAERLEQLRCQQPDYLGPSFAPIVGAGDHSAIVHYSATETSNAAIPKRGFLLVDSGGHYLQGTTDCTRTFALGPLTAEQKSHYTMVLRGNLKLAAAQFMQGCTGVNLDYLARAPLWEKGLDFRHGTGHGVGQVLSVHEGPNAIRQRTTANDVPLAPGMITSNEPGAYLEGQYGIRLENLLLCVESQTTQFGQFLAFQALTLVPFDLDAVAAEEMTQEERVLLDAYHAKVRAALTPHLSAGEAAWLAKATRPLAP